MNENVIDLLVGVTWFTHAVGFIWLATGSLRLAKQLDGSIFQWPIAGRYLIFALALSLAILALDVVRIRFQIEFFNQYWSDAPDSLSVLAIRVLPLLFLFSITLRIYHGGLTRKGDTTEPPIVETLTDIDRPTENGTASNAPDDPDTPIG